MTDGNQPSERVDAPSEPPASPLRSSSNSPPETLTAEEIVSRLDATIDPQDGTSKIVDDIYDLAQKQLVAEEAHSAKLDARATSLFGAVGFSMTIAFSFGGWALLDNARKVPSGHAIAVFFLVALVIGLITSGIALAGVRLKWGHKFVDETDIFNGAVVVSGAKQTDYRVHVATHLWLVWQDRARRNERRARFIQVGQWAFFFFLCAVLVLSGLTTLSALHRAPEPPVEPTICKVSIQSPPAQNLPAGRLDNTPLGAGPSVAKPIETLSPKQEPVKPPPRVRPKPGRGRPGIGNVDR